MNYNYILLVRKDDVIDFIKYGHYYPVCNFIEFDGDIAALGKDKKQGEKLFKNANDFEYGIEYYMLNICSGTKISKTRMLGISELRGIYAIDKDAVKIGLSINPQVTLYPPIWPNSVFENFQIQRAIKNCESGLLNISEIFGISFEKMRPRFVTKKIREDIVRKSFFDERPNGKQSIWEYLCRYERHHNYPKDMRGFFLDALHATFNFKKGVEIDDPVYNTGLGRDIYQQSSDIRYNELIALVESHEKFVGYTEKQFKRYYKIAPLFMILKTAFEDGLDPNQKYFNMSLDQFIEALKNPKLYDQEDIKYALYLVGMLLGWTETYKYLYMKRKLMFLTK